MVLTGIRLEEFPDKSILLIEEDIGDIKRIFVQMISYDAIKSGKNVLYLTPGLKEDVDAQMSIYGLNGPGKMEVVEKFNDKIGSLDISGYDICIIENIPIAFVNSKINELLDFFKMLLNSSRNNNTIIFLTSNLGIVPDQYQRVMRSMADMVIQLTVTFTESRINRYIYITKVKSGQPPEKMLPYSVDEYGKKLYIDTRERYG